MHSGCRGTAVPNVCLQAFSLFPLLSSPLDQKPVHSLAEFWRDNKEYYGIFFKKGVISLSLGVS